MHEGSSDHGHVEELVAVERKVKAPGEEALGHARCVEAGAGLQCMKLRSK